MNGKRIIILISALAISALIIWHELPIEFPWIAIKLLRLGVMLAVLLAVAIYAFIFVGGKRKPS
jgi:hypothetical protein